MCLRAPFSSEYGCSAEPREVFSTAMILKHCCADLRSVKKKNCPFWGGFHQKMITCVQESCFHMCSFGVGCIRYDLCRLWMQRFPSVAPLRAALPGCTRPLSCPMLACEELLFPHLSNADVSAL